ncbi:hypothetical protein ACNQKP_17495 [Bdellovibrio bacteriovorus]|uniref:hypothetical protein n=1 Tax=Bdellovibrio bacteriovorus TaxID=959 RepID=UPI003AA9B00D
MIKTSCSSIHGQHIVTFFVGGTKGLAGTYLFSESTLLFGQENLGVNLVEIEDSEFEGAILGQSPQIISLLKKLGEQGSESLSAIEVLISDEQVDLVVEFDKKWIHPFRVVLLRDVIEGSYGFTLEVREFEAPTGMYGLKPESASFIRVKVGKEFLQNRSRVLSPHLINHFDDSRYVDTQIPFFLLMSLLAGSAELSGSAGKKE